MFIFKKASQVVYNANLKPASEIPVQYEPLRVIAYSQRTCTKY